MASSARQCFTILTDEDGVPGSKFEREPEEYTVEQLKRWLKCRGLKLNGKRDELLKRVSDCLKSEDHHTLDPSIDNGKWFAAKILKESSEKQADCPLNSLPIIPSTGWRVFPSQNIPSLFNYGHVHYYVLESIQNVSNGAKDIEDGLGHMTDKPMKNGRKYVDSGFVHDIVDTASGDHYFVRAHVWPSMRNELPHNVTVVISANSGAILYASCEPCRASSLDRCSHVVAVLFSVLDYVQKHGPLLTQPCTSQECSWNKGKKRNKNPRRVSDAKYPNKKKNASLALIDFDPRPAKNRHVNVHHINNFLSNVQALSQAEGGELTMWETQLKLTFNDYKLECERKKELLEQVSALQENLKPEALMEIPGTRQQSKSEKWFSERWCRLTASKCLSAFKVGRLVVESQPNAAVEAEKFIFSNIWGLESEHFQSYWMRYGIECEPEAILKYENATKTKVSQTGFWVNPKFPFLGCSPDGLVGSDTVVEIKSLKIFKQYSVERVTSSTSPVPKSVLSRQCFKVENGKCVLKHSHSYFYQCQQILLVTGRKYCDFILHAASGPDSVERIPRDEALIEKILSYLTALWTRVIAPEIFEMRVPRDLLPLILAEPVDIFDPLEHPLSASPVDGSTPEDPPICTSLASPVDCLEADVLPKQLTTDEMDPATPVSSTSLHDMCEKTPVDLPSSLRESKQPFLADSSCTQEEMDTAEAPPLSVASTSCNPTSASEQDQELTIFPWGGRTSNGITLTNTCPLDNWLMIFQALVKSNKVKLQDLPESGHIIATALRLIYDGLYADAKLLILQSLPRQQQGTSLYALIVIDSFYY